MADFKFLRTADPDVMRYLPKFLAEDEHFAVVQDSHSKEHGIQKELLADIARQFFVDTATWGLDTWERIYKTEPPIDASYELRRALIKTKMLGRQVMTKANTELIVNQYVDNGKGYVIEDYAPGAIKVVMPGRVDYPDALVKALNEMLPAHLGVSYELVVNDTDKDGNIDLNGGVTIYYGLMNGIFGRKSLSLVTDAPESMTAKSRIGTINVFTGDKVLGLEAPSDMTSSIACASLKYVAGIKTIDADADKSERFITDNAVSGVVYSGGAVVLTDKSYSIGG